MSFNYALFSEKQRTDKTYNGFKLTIVEGVKMTGKENFSIEWKIENDFEWKIWYIGKVWKIFHSFFVFLFVFLRKDRKTSIEEIKFTRKSGKVFFRAVERKCIKIRHSWWFYEKSNSFSRCPPILAPALNTQRNSFFKEYFSIYDSRNCQRLKYFSAETFKARGR